MVTEGGRKLGTAATCDPPRGASLQLDTVWEHGTGVTSSHGRRTRYIYTAIRAILWSLPFPTFHFHYTYFNRLLLSIYCYLNLTGPITTECVPPVHHGNPHHIQLQLSTVLPQATAAAGCSRNQNIKTPE